MAAGEPFDEARAHVAAALAGDVPYIQPPDQRHLVGETVLLSLGSAVVGAFAAGVVKAAAGQAEEWAASAAAWLAARIRAAFSGEEDGQEPTAAVREYARIVVILDQRELEAYEASATTTLTISLEQQGLPSRKAVRLADVTRQRMRER